MRNTLFSSPLSSPLLLLLLPIGCASTGVGAPADDGGGGSPDATASSSGSSGGSGSSSSSSGSGSGSGSGSSSSGSSSGSGSGASSSGATDAGKADGGDGGAVGCTGQPLCDDFESDTPGMPPSTALWSTVMGCNPMFTPNGAVDGGGVIIGIDGTKAHSGHNSLRVVGGDSCGFYAVNTTAFTKLTAGTVYARFYASFSGPPTTNHNGYLSMTTTAGDGGIDHLRLGFQDQIIDWNQQSSDSTMPDLDPQGAALSTVTNPNNWDCFEFSVDTTTGNIQFWLNSAPIQGLSFTASQAPTQGVNDQWANSGAKPPFSITNFGLGWLGLNNQYTAWFDDVALSNGRIGCP